MWDRHAAAREPRHLHLVLFKPITDRILRRSRQSYRRRRGSERGWDLSRWDSIVSIIQWISASAPMRERAAHSDALTQDVRWTREWMGGWMDVWMDGWIKYKMDVLNVGWTDGWVVSDRPVGWMCMWVDVHMNECMDGWMDGWSGEQWVGGWCILGWMCMWMSGLIKGHGSLHGCICVYMYVHKY